MKLTDILVDIITEGSVKSDERIKIYQDDRILAVIPLSHKASCKYGANTPWCVAVPSTTEHYDEYSKNGVFVYFIIKSPHPDAKIPEYKFAYYYSYHQDTKDLQGWYDMADYQYRKGEEDEQMPDTKLIKFLIPDNVFKMSVEYIKEYRKVWVKKEKEKLEQGYFILADDPDNIKIVDDNEWLIVSRVKPHHEAFEIIYGWSRTMMPKQRMYVCYMNKKTHNGIEQDIPFVYDIRAFIEPTMPNTNFIQGYKIGTVDHVDVTKLMTKYYKPIANEYFKQRQANYEITRGLEILLPPTFVSADDIFGDYGKLILAYRCKSHNSGICFDTERSKNMYYSDDAGAGLKYDAIRHNDPNLPRMDVSTLQEKTPGS
jgi:hypothetical protein